MEINHHRILQNDIKRDILTGLFREGDLLPSENELCSRYNLTRSTVRKVLDELVNEGYIIKKKGKGSIVNIRRNSIGLLSHKGFYDILGDTEMKIRSIMLQDPVIIRWPPNFFYPLTEEENKAGTIFLNRLRFIEDNPVMLEYAYLPNIGLEGFLDEPLLNDSLFATLRERYGVEITNVYQDLRAIPADPGQAELLNIYPAAPILHIYKRYVTNREDLMIYISLYCNTHRFYISNEFD